MPCTTRKVLLDSALSERVNSACLSVRGSRIESLYSLLYGSRDGRRVTAPGAIVKLDEGGERRTCFTLGPCFMLTPRGAPRVPFYGKNVSRKLKKRGSFLCAREKGRARQILPDLRRMFGRDRL